jgi:hypothetical protein
MAISAPHYHALKELANRGEFAQHGTLLEIGEANYYGDQPLDVVLADVSQIADAARRKKIFDGLIDAFNDVKNPWRCFMLVKWIYELFLQPSLVDSIDMDGTPLACKRDLNQELEFPIPYEVVINHGTAEHIFNIANVFRVMHDACKAGGLMIHESPFVGWVDHGFYCLQPTLFFDVAAANKYDIRYLAIEHIESRMLHEVKSREEIHELARAGKLPNNAMLYVAMRKTADDAFKIPMQGVYAQNVSESVQQAWKALR